jgi:hypothetical protein
MGWLFWLLCMVWQPLHGPLITAWTLAPYAIYAATAATVSGIRKIVRISSPSLSPEKNVAGILIIQLNQNLCFIPIKDGERQFLIYSNRMQNSNPMTVSFGG